MGLELYTMSRVEKFIEAKVIMAPMPLPSPFAMDRDKIYVQFDAAGIQQYANFWCPCGGRAFLSLPLKPSNIRGWDCVIEADNTVTISPSIQNHGPCTCHYFIKNGNVQLA